MGISPPHHWVSGVSSPQKNRKQDEALSAFKDAMLQPILRKERVHFTRPVAEMRAVCAVISLVPLVFPLELGLYRCLLLVTLVCSKVIIAD